jgi:hypothetical protein
MMMDTLSTNTAWIIVAAAGAVLLIIAAVAVRRSSQKRRANLRHRFGPEYDRAVEEFGSPERAERNLAARARRVDHIRFRDLTDADRARFTSTWAAIQAQFVDDPVLAVKGANELIKEVMRARGYPADGFEQRAEDLSVDHPEVVQHYRAARALADSSRNRQVNTEELRQAVVHYRALFADLLQTSVTQSLREAHA